VTVDIREMPTKVGQLVEVVLRGRVSGLLDTGGFDLGEGPGANLIQYKAEHVVSVEVLPEPVASWQAGDAVCCRPGAELVTLTRRRDGTWTCSAAGCEVTHTDAQVDADVACGSTVLVRGGEVQPDHDTRAAVLSLLDLEHVTEPCPRNELGPCSLAHQVARTLGVAP
jgi:hypothetical protein